MNVLWMSITYFAKGSKALAVKEAVVSIVDEKLHGCVEKPCETLLNRGACTFACVHDNELSCLEPSIKHIMIKHIMTKYIIDQAHHDQAHHDQVHHDQVHHNQAHHDQVHHDHSVTQTKALQSRTHTHRHTH